MAAQSVRRMGSRVGGLGRTGRIVGFAVAALAAAAAVAYGGLSWRLSHGPIPVAFLNDRIVHAVASNLPGDVGVRIAGTVVERDPATGRIQLSLIDVAAVDAAGEPIFSAPRAIIHLSSGALLTGRVVPEGVWLIEPAVTLVETPTGLSLRGEITGAAVEGAPATAIAGAIGLSSEVGGLARFGIRNGGVSIVDGAGGSRSGLDRVSVTFARNADGFAFDLSIGEGIGAPQLAGTLRRDGQYQILDVDLRDIAVGDFGALAPPGLASIFSGPVTGDVVLRLKPDGSVEAVSGHILAGAGHVGGDRLGLLVDEADLTFSWSRATRRLVVEPSTILAGYNRATVSAQIVLPERDEFGYGTVPIRLEVSDIAFSDPAGGRGAEYPLIALEALYLPREGVVHIGRLDVAAADGAMSFVGVISGGGESPGVQLAGTMLPVPYDALADLWPPFIDYNTRRWVIDHLSAGRITDVRFTVNIPPGALAAAMRGVRLPPSAYLLEFSLEDVVFRYLGDMPPISGARGRAALTPDTFNLTLDAGAVVRLDTGETVTVGAGRYRVRDVRAVPATGEVSLELAGSASAMLRLFDHHPLEIASQRGIDPGGVSGDAELAIDLAIPMLPELHLSDIDLHVEGGISNLSAEDFHAGHDISEAEVRISARDGRIRIVGEGLVDGVPAEISVDEALDGTGAGGGQSVTMTLDEAARRHLGLGLDGILTGPVTATVADLQATDAGASQRIEADLTAARIDFPALGIDKPPGVAASASLLLHQDGNMVRLSELTVESDAIRISGEAVFDRSEGLVRIDLPVVRTAHGTDVSVTGNGEGRGDVYEVRGKAVDVRTLLRGMSPLGGAAERTTSTSADAGRTQVDIAVDALIGLNGQRLTGVRGAVTHIGDTIARIALTGRTSSGASLTLRYVDEPGGGEIVADTEDGGGLLAWTGLYGHMRGGRLQLAGHRHGADQPLTGRLVINGFAVANDPSLTELIASGEQGTRQQFRRTEPAERRRGVNPSNVGFHTLSLPFMQFGNQLRITDGVLRGPAVGATLEGTVNLADSHMALSGTYVPFYEINNLFGQLPLFGPLLGGGRNEGLVGITYSVSGPLDDPVLTVNPLSFVTPGVFRYILGMDNPRAVGTRRNGPREDDPAAR